MTERLYYHNATLQTFTAKVVAEKMTERGPAVQLDQTAFYPTSGGQPHDMGTLNGILVHDVWDDEAGDVWHLLNSSLDADTVQGQIDWSRRFDHMQQHSGQHLLSAGFAELLDAATVGFHLGRESSTIDLNIRQLSWKAVASVEQAVNAVVFENRAVTVQVVSQEDLAAIPLRKAPQVTGKIRVVWIADYDASACGGTHVSRTGQIGLIKVSAIERYKGGMRVTFLCGERARADYHRALTILRTVSQELTVGQDELHAAVIRLRDEAKTTRKSLNQAQSKLMQFEAEQLWEETAEIDGIRCIVQHWQDLTFANVRMMASQLREKARTLLLFAVTEEKGLRFVCARSDDLTGIDAADLLRAAAAELGGRGGGSPTMAQGGAQNATPEAVLAALNLAARIVNRAI
jgi:alanyl-tRNA synthetase